MRVLAFIAIAALATRWLVRREHSRRHALETPAAPPEPLRRWEGEGGGVPVGGSRIAAQVHEDDPLAPPSQGSAATPRWPPGV